MVPRQSCYHGDGYHVTKKTSPLNKLLLLYLPLWMTKYDALWRWIDYNLDTDSTVFSVSKVTCFIIVAFFEKAELLGSKPTTVSYFSPFPAVSFVHCVSSDRFNSLVIANHCSDEIPISRLPALRVAMVTTILLPECRFLIARLLLSKQKNKAAITNNSRLLKHS